MSALFATLTPALGVLGMRALGLRWRDDRLGFCAWAWLLGCLLLGLGVQLALELHLPPGWWWTAPLVLAGLVGLLGSRVTAASPLASPSHTIGRGYTVFVLLGVALALLFVAAGMDRPCIEGDEGNIWSLKAKSLLVDWPAQFAATQVYNLHPDYPQLNPLLQAWVYAWTGAPDFVQFENRWPVQLCNVALFVAVASALRRRLPPWPAAALAALVLLEPEFQSLCRTAYADGMVALGVVVALDGLQRWREHGDRRFAWLGAFGLAFALWSKNETMLYLVAAGGAALLTRLWVPSLAGGFSRRNLRLLLPAVFVAGYSMLWNRRFGMRSDLFGNNPTGKSMFALMAEQWPERVPALCGEALRLFVDVGHAHVVFALLLLGAVLAPRAALRSAMALPVLTLGASFVGLHVVYVGSFLPLRFHLDTSYTRVLFQLLPAAVVLLGCLLAEVVAARPTGHTASRP
ncbi:MAG: hypothetical protein H6838_10935 [Planctomycetes bacterium]|nr:hypothetical protein [Planctomycetota bacterium]MCB9886001.1 hypothetical protein [Planctomycetota bacterium]